MTDREAEEPGLSGLPKPGERFGRFVIDRQLARGGMGVVYVALQEGLGREVALKILNADLAASPDLRRRFMQEAETLARIDSPHVIRVFDAGEKQGWMYIATQLLPDGDLQSYLKTHGALPLSQALEIVRQVAQGLAEAHDLGIVHRDIKPANILLKADRHGAPVAVLCDFGISRRMGTAQTRTQGVVGTLGYMAPERHDGEEATEASDVYALGCLLWALLTGQAPWTGPDVQVALGHLHGPVPQLEPTFAGAGQVNDLLTRSMAKAARQRHPSARAFLLELTGVLKALGAEAPLDPARLRAAQSDVEPSVATVMRPAPPTSLPPAAVGGRAAEQTVHRSRLSEAGQPRATDGHRVGRPPRTRWLVGALVVGLVVALGGFSLWRLLAAPDTEAGAAASPDGDEQTNDPSPRVEGPGDRGGRQAVDLPKGPRLPPANLLFVRGPRDDRSIVAADVAGGTLGQVVASRGAVADYPVLSPDRRTLLYVADGRLRVVGVDGSDDRLLLRDQSRCPSPRRGAWAPAERGRYIVLVCEGNPGNAMGRELAVLDLQTMAMRTLVRHVSVGSPTVAPGLPQVAYCRGTRDQACRSLWIAPLGAGAPRQLTSGADYIDGGPAWSPNGRSIAFRREPAADPGAPDVYAIAPDGSGLRGVTRGDAADTSPSWSPDGSHIAFRSSFDQLKWAPRIWVIPSNGSGAPVRMIEGDTENADQPIWSRR